ncbi:MAG TPA: hypothetical protein VFV24_08525 [Candidatus Eisenbacteria bacterium]|nr:hypothetical protein [Candidatus Eisenbacteria bacterium]
MERLRNHLLRRQMFRWMLVPAALTVLVVAGCSDDDDDDDNNPAPTQTQMHGGFAGGTAGGATETGTLDVTVNSGTLAARFPNEASATLVKPASAAVVAASAVMDPEGAGSTVLLSGTYNTDSDSLFLSGSGYTLQGARTNVGAGQSIEGLYTGPNGTGAFYALAPAGEPIQSYCGDYMSGTQADSGFVALSVRGSSVTGLSISTVDLGDILRWNGTMTGSGTVRDVTIVDPLNPGGAPLAQGTWDTSLDTMNGTYGFGGDTGTWDAVICD